MDNNSQPIQEPTPTPVPEQPQPAPAPIAPPTPPSPEPQPFAPVSPGQPAKKPANLLKIIIPVAILLVGAIVAVILILNSKQSNPPVAPDTPDNPKPTQEAPQEISLEWFDGTAPGTTYSLTLNSVTGEFHLKSQPGCSTIECSNGTTSPEATEYSGTYSSEDLAKILDFYSILDFSSQKADSYARNFWFLSLATLAEPEKVTKQCAEDDTDCLEADLDGNGIITHRETAYSVLDELKEEKLKAEELKAQLIEETGSEYLNCMPIVPEDRVERCDYAYSINYPYITF